ncbi:MAG: hypothetical protein IVW57_05555 [Ktedonobacterales bacterium]|nr:hypothetical protein [Ktedonobacterales bacterium]
MSNPQPEQQPSNQAAYIAALIAAYVAVEQFLLAQITQWLTVSAPTDVGRALLYQRTQQLVARAY